MRNVEPRPAQVSLKRKKVQNDARVATISVATAETAVRKLRGGGEETFPDPADCRDRARGGSAGEARIQNQGSRALQQTCRR